MKVPQNQVASLFIVEVSKCRDRTPPEGKVVEVDVWVAYSLGAEVVGDCRENGCFEWKLEIGVLVGQVVLALSVVFVELRGPKLHYGWARISANT